MAVKKEDVKETASVKTTETAKEEMQVVEDLAKEAGTDPIVFAGVLAQMQWRPGRSVTRAEFDKAVDAFTNGPADGRKK